MSVIELLDAIKRNASLRTEILQRDCYADVAAACRQHGISISDEDQAWLELGYGEDDAESALANEQVARYGWGSCLVCLAVNGCFEGYDNGT